MKATIITILLLTTATMFAPPSSNDICVAIPDADVGRVTEAFGSILNLHDEAGNPRPATNQEVTDATAQWLGQSTHDYERRKNQAEFTPPPFQQGSKLNAPTPTPPPTSTQYTTGGYQPQPQVPLKPTPMPVTTPPPTPTPTPKSKKR